MPCESVSLLSETPQKSDAVPVMLGDASCIFSVPLERFTQQSVQKYETDLVIFWIDRPEETIPGHVVDQMGGGLNT